MIQCLFFMTGCSVWLKTAVQFYFNIKYRPEHFISYVSPYAAATAPLCSNHSAPRNFHHFLSASNFVIQSTCLIFPTALLKIRGNDDGEDFLCINCFCTQQYAIHQSSSKVIRETKVRPSLKSGSIPNK